MAKKIVNNFFNSPPGPFDRRKSQLCLHTTGSKKKANYSNKDKWFYEIFHLFGFNGLITRPDIIKI